MSRVETERRTDSTAKPFDRRDREWGRKRGRPARSSLFAIFQGEKLVRQEIATFPVLRRVGNTDDGKTNLQFLGRAAHPTLSDDGWIQDSRQKAARCKCTYRIASSESFLRSPIPFIGKNKAQRFCSSPFQCSAWLACGNQSVTCVWCSSARC